MGKSDHVQKNDGVHIEYGIALVWGSIISLSAYFWYKVLPVLAYIIFVSIPSMW